ncbi:hypothetical protein CCACVL1_15488 [Corchorus capsularis]|uniref:Gnk2-homologous domain-containing protein n=1 Tax=Corchorus capsularis TaxID=210143 RepID=A0A1R3I2A6_COCAP|nr:hypothetical protein CCACVL1_15488 [Corchorus capsularis]
MKEIFKGQSFIFILVLILPLGISQLDSNEKYRWDCSSDADNSTSFKANLDTLLNSLTQNVALHSGFYKTTVGEYSDKIYGLVQCRADVSAENCANCTKQSVATALKECSTSKSVQVWFTWCTLRYSNNKFFGVMDSSSSARLNFTNLENSSMILRGVSFMKGVASAAATQRLRFNASVFDAGQFGKRYGMAQCIRDISKGDCSKCLESPLETFTLLEDKRNWEVHGTSCSMWYHDYQFFSNISISTNHVLILPLGISQLDSNEKYRWDCSSDADNSTSFKANLDTLLNSLTQNVALHNGFYKTTVREYSDKIYGLVQCRADVSADNCANCTKQSVATALKECSTSNSVQIWFTWCTLRYSNKKFFGVMDSSLSSKLNFTNLENVSMILRGVSFMKGVASAAATQRLRFNASVFDAGQFGKRYGMAQCIRDISKGDCSKCLESPLETFHLFEDKRNWEVYGTSCSMWYHDYQFFSNISIPTNHGARRKSIHGVLTGTTMAMILMFLFLL